jgi:hypothetical protein
MTETVVQKVVRPLRRRRQAGLGLDWVRLRQRLGRQWPLVRRQAALVHRRRQAALVHRRRQAALAHRRRQAALAHRRRQAALVRRQAALVRRRAALARRQAALVRRQAALVRRQAALVRRQDSGARLAAACWGRECKCSIIRPSLTGDGLRDMSKNLRELGMAYAATPEDAGAFAKPELGVNMAGASQHGGQLLAGAGARINERNKFRGVSYMPHFFICDSMRVFFGRGSPDSVDLKRRKGAPEYTRGLLHPHCL